VIVSYGHVVHQNDCSYALSCLKAFGAHWWGVPELAEEILIFRHAKTGDRCTLQAFAHTTFTMLYQGRLLSERAISALP
jgi:hypothetical protein